VVVFLVVQSAAQVKVDGLQVQPPKELYQKTGLEGTITGKITLRGDAPTPRRIEITFKCNRHPWQRACVSVLTQPFFSVTGEDGQYRIEGVPPGGYRLEVWHERLKPQSVEVSLGPNEVKTRDFSLTSEAR